MCTTGIEPKMSIRAICGGWLTASAAAAVDAAAAELAAAALGGVEAVVEVSVGAMHVPPWLHVTCRKQTKGVISACGSTLAGSANNRLSPEPTLSGHSFSPSGHAALITSLLLTLALRPLLLVTEKVMV
jgi:hypothetical protein